MKVGRWLGVLECGFAAVAVVALGYYSWAWAEARLFQARESRRLDEALLLKQTLSGAAMAPRLSIADRGGLLGRLEIPRIGISVMVVEGTGDADLRRAVGHIRGTALPGEDGNVAIAGHRDTFFRPLDSIRRNDTIILTTWKGTCRYQVVSTEVVRPEEVDVLSPTGRNSLTLVTCFPFAYVGPAPMRFIVRAEASPQAAGPSPTGGR